MKLAILIFNLVIYNIVYCESQHFSFINEIEELNCNFTSTFCNWSPIALPPENPNRWKIISRALFEEKNNNSENGVIISSQSLFPSQSFPLSVAYAQFNKRSGSASLISNEFLCHSEPIQITLQAYVTPETKLFICYRIIVNNLTSRFSKCDEIKVERYNEWENQTINKIYQSSPYQIIFRAFGSNKNNFVAIKNLNVTDGGSICKGRNARNSNNNDDREQNNNQIKVITYEDWQKIRKGNEPPPQVHPRILLVVSEHVETSKEMEKGKTEVETTTSPILTLPTTSTLKPSIAKCLDDFCTEKESSEEEEESTEKAESKDDVTESLSDKTTKSPSADPQNLPSLGQWVQLLKNVAPIIPIIPSLINSLKYNESPQPISSTATFNNQQYSGSDATFRNEEKVFSWKPGETRRAPTPITPQQSINQNLQKNVFGISTSNIPLMNGIVEVTPSSSSGTLFKQDLNLSSLTVNELKTLETIHKKIFPIASSPKPPPHTSRGESRRKGESRKRINDRIINYHEPSSSTTSSTTSATTPAMVIFEKPKQQLSDARTSVSQNMKYLTPQMIEELNMVSNLPDLEVLTEGLDLSLLNKPGGFAVLKQQFMERLLKRLPFKEDDTDLLRDVRYRS